MTESEYIIDLAIRYKEGNISKYMLNKYIECAINIFEYKVSSMLIPQNIFYSLAFCYAIRQVGIIMYQPTFPKGGTNGAIFGCSNSSINIDERVLLSKEKVIVSNEKQTPIPTTYDLLKNIVISGDLIEKTKYIESPKRRKNQKKEYKKSSKFN